MTQVATQKREPLTIEAITEQVRPQLTTFLGKIMDPERFILLIRSAWKAKPQLQRCTWLSVMKSIQAAAELALEPDSSTKQAHLIPYGDECTFQIGYRGYISLARRTGEVHNMWAAVVCKGDVFHEQLGSDPKIIHEPNYEVPRTESNFLLCYAVAEFKDGRKQHLVSTRQYVEQCMGCAKTKDIWNTWEEDMWRKTALKRLSKYLDISNPVWTRALELDDDHVVTEPLNPGVRQSRALRMPREVGMTYQEEQEAPKTLPNLLTQHFRSPGDDEMPDRSELAQPQPSATAPVRAEAGQAPAAGYGLTEKQVATLKAQKAPGAAQPKGVTLHGSGGAQVDPTAVLRADVLRLMTEVYAAGLPVPDVEAKSLQGYSLSQLLALKDRLANQLKGGA